MINWRSLVAVFFFGAGVGAAALDWWRSRKIARAADAEGPDEPVPPLPLHNDPRWEQIPCPEGDHDCPMVWLRLGQALAGIGPDVVRLISGEYEVGNEPGAHQYVEAVHAIWRARRAGLN